jgi:hypothetical protein
MATNSVTDIPCGILLQRVTREKTSRLKIGGMSPVAGG